MTPKREQAVKARIRQNHMDDILEAIENIRHSSFLQGQNKEGWMITFDWFLKPGNFRRYLKGTILINPVTSLKATWRKSKTG